MPAGCFRFGDFTFDPGERLLRRDGERLELSGRYLDALALLLREQGRLVTKDRFMTEVWRGVPVTDDALTQCVRALRRRLGDDAARPRFIETVPKHGYRFVAAASWVEAQPRVATVPIPVDWLALLRTAGLAGLGGAIAGVGGGLLYGIAASPPLSAQGMGAISMLLVLLAVSVALGLVAGVGVGTGVALAELLPRDRWQWRTAGGMLGGLVIGGVARLVGLDAFTLLFGRSLAGMTGAAEGALLGAAVGFAVWRAATRGLAVAASAATGALAGAAAGLLVPLLGGHLLGGSLNLLARGFPDARFRLDAIGALLGEGGFGRASEVLTATIEGGLFGLCVVGTLAVARGRAEQTTLPSAGNARAAKS